MAAIGIWRGILPHSFILLCSVWKGIEAYVWCFCFLEVIFFSSQGIQDIYIWLGWEIMTSSKGWRCLLMVDWLLASPLTIKGLWSLCQGSIVRSFLKITLQFSPFFHHKTTRNSQTSNNILLGGDIRNYATFSARCNFFYEILEIFEKFHDFRDKNSPTH